MYCRLDYMTTNLSINNIASAVDGNVVIVRVGDVMFAINESVCRMISTIFGYEAEINPSDGVLELAGTALIAFNETLDLVCGRGEQFIGKVRVLEMYINALKFRNTDMEKVHVELLKKHADARIIALLICVTLTYTSADKLHISTSAWKLVRELETREAIRNADELTATDEYLFSSTTQPLVSPPLFRDVNENCILFEYNKCKNSSFRAYKPAACDENITEIQNRSEPDVDEPPSVLSVPNVEAILPTAIQRPKNYCSDRNNFEVSDIPKCTQNVLREISFKTKESNAENNHSFETNISNCDSNVRQKTNIRDKSKNRHVLEPPANIKAKSTDPNFRERNGKKEVRQFCVHCEGNWIPANLTIKTAGGKLKTNRQILSASSPVFERIIQCTPKYRPLDMTSTSKSTVKGVLDFVVSLKVPQFSSDAAFLFLAGIKYDLPEMERAYANLLLENLDESLVYNLMDTASMQTFFPCKELVWDSVRTVVGEEAFQDWMDAKNSEQHKK